MSGELEPGDREQKVRYRIARDPDDFAEGDSHPWGVNVYRDGKWSGACCYMTGAEALAAYNDGIER